MRSLAEEEHKRAQWQKQVRPTLYGLGQSNDLWLLQIDFGKNTLGYQQYLKVIPK
jgi:hypothetical protein